MLFGFCLVRVNLLLSFRVNTANCNLPMLFASFYFFALFQLSVPFSLFGLNKRSTMDWTSLNRDYLGIVVYSFVSTCLVHISLRSFLESDSLSGCLCLLHHSQDSFILGMTLIYLPLIVGLGLWRKFGDQKITQSEEEDKGKLSIMFYRISYCMLLLPVVFIQILAFLLFFQSIKDVSLFVPLVRVVDGLFASFVCFLSIVMVSRMVNLVWLFKTLSKQEEELTLSHKPMNNNQISMDHLQIPSKTVVESYEKRKSSVDLFTLLDLCLENPNQFQKLLQRAEARYCSEAVIFLKRVHGWKRLCTRFFSNQKIYSCISPEDVTLLRKEALAIYLDFFVKPGEWGEPQKRLSFPCTPPSAPCELNVNDRIRKEIKSKLMIRLKTQTRQPMCCFQVSGVPNPEYIVHFFDSAEKEIRSLVIENFFASLVDEHKWSRRDLQQPSYHPYDYKVREYKDDKDKDDKDKEDSSRDNPNDSPGDSPGDSPSNASGQTELNIPIVPASPVSPLPPLNLPPLNLPPSQSGLSDSSGIPSFYTRTPFEPSPSTTSPLPTLTPPSRGGPVDFPDEKEKEYLLPRVLFGKGSNLKSNLKLIAKSYIDPSVEIRHPEASPQSIP